MQDFPADQTITPATAGLHHVTAIAVDPQGTLDFYTRVMGLRLVKQTVNFDDPGTWHFYFGDRTGRPGTILTFFPFPLAGRGRPGAGMVDAVAFAAPATSIEDWIVRLSGHGLDVEGPFERFGEPAIAVADPHGLRLEIVGTVASGSSGGDPGVLRGLHSVSLSVAAPEHTAALLVDTFGLHAVGDRDGRIRLRAGGNSAGAIIDLRAGKHEEPPRLGGGSVHHIAFRAASDADQAALREAVLGLGLQPTDILDRNYFRSFYFREPGGILFEVATDAPGFLVDETVDDLGRSLQLPAWLEPRRAVIETKLPPLRIPGPAP